jgi:hypothetical protein
MPAPPVGLEQPDASLGSIDRDAVEERYVQRKILKLIDERTARVGHIRVPRRQLRLVVVRG